MKERPILFSGPMVRALLDGSKTQTRRVLKPQPDFSIIKAEYQDPSLWEFRKRFMMYADDWSGHEHAMYRKTERGDPDLPIYQHRSPFGEPGDRLWVRETFCIESNRMTDDDAGPPFNDGRPVERFGDDDHYWKQPHYRASDPEPELWYEDMDGPGVRWTPSIHMPRWVSRITLEVIGVRVERLQDISPEDCIADGIELSRASFMPQGFRLYDKAGKVFCTNPIESYRSLWDSLKPAAGAAWADNPWVWVIEFKRVKT